VLAEPGEAPHHLEEIAGALGGLNHVTRLRVLILLRKKDRELSPKTMAMMLDMPIGAVSYHVRGMADKGLIEVTRVEQRRGALEHFYKETELGHRWRRTLKL
jgi:DNA-binding transcriptional ArsR family regulator